MKFVTRLAILLVVGALGSGPARAQEYKWVRGTVTAVTATTLDIYVAGLGLNLAFHAGDDSIVFARGSLYEGPPERRAPALNQVIRAGDEVEVHYERQGDRNHAAVVLPSAKERPEAGRSVLGTVTEASAEQVIVEADGRTHTFEMRPGSVIVVPKGRRGQKAPGGDSIVPKSRVLVLYRAGGDRRIAVEVHQVPEPR